MKTETAIATLIVLAFAATLYVAAYQRTRQMILRSYLVGWRYDALRNARERRRPEDEAWANRNQAVRALRVGALVVAVESEMEVAR